MLLAEQLHRLQQIHQALAAEPVKGFLSENDGQTLFEAVMLHAPGGLCLEVGSYCGKSTVYLASACQARGQTLLAVDHHQGSEEHQPGEAYHDPELATPDGSGIDTFRSFRQTLRRWDLEPWVLPLVADSALVARSLPLALALVFIDGGHSPEAALCDCCLWAEKLVPGGILAVHDVIADPAEGGQGPYWAVQTLLAEYGFEQVFQRDTLVLLKKPSSKRV
jgi:MMP 1-O-methyltransferase